MAEEQRVAVLEVVLDGLLVDLGLERVRDEDHDDVGLGGGLGHGHHTQALLLGLGLGLGAFVQTDADVDTRVTQRQRVGVALAAVTDHRDLAALDDGQVGIVVVEQLGHWIFSLVCRWCVPPYGGIAEGSFRVSVYERALESTWGLRPCGRAPAGSGR